MRKSRFLMGWGILLAVLLFIAGLTPLAGGTGTDGITVTFSKVPFFQLVKTLVGYDPGKTVKQLDINSDLASVDITTQTPVREILATLCKAHGMDMVLENDTYIIKNHVEDAPPAPPLQPVAKIDPLPINPTVPAIDTPYANDTAEETDAPMVAEMITLQNTSVGEICWLLGVDGAVSPARDRRQVINNRMKNVLTPSQTQIDTSQGGEYYSPMLGSTKLWPADLAPDSGSLSGGYQVFPGGNLPGTVLPPTGTVPPVVRPNQPGNPVNPNQPFRPTTNPGGIGNTQYNSASGSGSLRNFIPEGIEQIVGIGALNQLLVRAKSRDDIKQFADFLKLIDRPTKQVVVELMFVKMSVDDAFSLGSSFKVSGVPFFAESVGTSSSGNFSLMYTQGNILAKISTLIANKRAKVVNAPRVVVQNNNVNPVDIHITSDIPFILTSEDQDIYGRITSTPQINVQSFTQGMTVNKCTILPDDSVILSVTPQVEDPGDTISIPGTSGSGSVSSSSSTEINNVTVRVKNGESIMMGGFVGENDSTASTRVPLLGDLPIIGSLLFRSTNNSKNSTETLFFLTPTIIFDDNRTTFDGMTSLPPVF